MSSDPIEVLRELEAKLNRLEAKYREAIKGRDAADPLTNHRLGLSEGFGVAAMCVRDALASLSAPKPESAEAVCPDCHGEGGLRWYEADGSERGETCGTCDGFGTAPQQASAPVGVEAIIEAFDEITGLCRHLRQGGPDPEDLQGLSDALEEAIDIAGNMLAALAQQHAAVDGAMVERAITAFFTHPGRGVNGTDDAMRAALTAALAGPQGGNQ